MASAKTGRGINNRAGREKTYLGIPGQLYYVSMTGAAG